ncbi:hypothetical protein C8R46DRAFT_1013130, partial [Mycena filopes]
MSPSHPIALPVHQQQQQDSYAMSLDGGSYNGEDGRAFNPASYTRHFLGSPISWRAGSFGATYCATSTSPSYELGPGSGRSPLKSPAADSSILNAWNVFDRQGELCRNYTCCGAHLADLHALLEHFEEVHIVVRAGGQAPSIQIPFNPQMNPPEPMASHSQAQQQQQSHLNGEPQHHLLQQPQYSTPFDTDDMDLGDYDEVDVDIDVGDDSPPPPSTAPTSTVTSRAPSPSPLSPKPALNISLSGVGFAGMHSGIHGHHPHHAHGGHTPFSAYARYNAGSGVEYSPGGQGQVTPQDVADYTPSPPDSSAHSLANANGGSGTTSSIAPALVFGTREELVEVESPVASTSALASASGSQTPSGSQGGKVPKAKKHGSHTGSSTGSRSAPPSRLPTPPGSAGPSSAHPSSSSSTLNSLNAAFSSAAAATGANTTALNGGNGSGATILLPHKPFRCPKPNCSKSYKQANGLKYHITHGSCNYGPAKDLEAVRALLERKRNAAALANAASNPNATEDDDGEAPTSGNMGGGQGNGGGQEQLSQAELNEVEARVRPFACGVGDCARRYKNMNGLRYHYQHSGDHGAVGLQMLAGGVHGCLRNNSSSSTTSASSTTTPSSSTSNSTPGTPVGATKGKGTATYAWGSTLLPHIQAVSATTATSNATAGATASTSATSTASLPASASSTPATGAKNTTGKGGKGKTEATPFTVPGAGGMGMGKGKGKGGSAPTTPAAATGTFPAAKTPTPPASSTSTFSATPTAQQQAQGTQAQQTEYLAQLQRAQYAQYQQWYASAQVQAQQQAQAAAVAAQRAG